MLKPFLTLAKALHHLHKTFLGIVDQIVLGVDDACMIEHTHQTRRQHGVNELDAIRKVSKEKESFLDNSRPSFMPAIMPLQFNCMTQISNREPGGECGDNQLEQELLGQTSRIRPDVCEQPEWREQQYHQQDTNDRGANARNHDDHYVSLQTLSPIGTIECSLTQVVDHLEDDHVNQRPRCNDEKLAGVINREERVR